MKNRIIVLVLLFFIVTVSFFIYIAETMTLFSLKKDVFTYEYGTEISKDVSDYVNCNHRILDSIKLNLHKVQHNVGTYDASVTYLSQTYKFKIKVVDSSRPKITLKKIVYTISEHNTLYAVNTIADIKDMSNTYAYFKYSEDSDQLVKFKTFMNVGTFIERVVVVDDNGNKSQPMRIKVIVERNKVPPKIIGIDDIEIALNSTFDLLSGVSATDDIDGNITDKITVTGNVNTAIPGTYEVNYTVKDKSGNTTKKTRKVTVIVNNDN